MPKKSFATELENDPAMNFFSSKKNDDDNDNLNQEDEIQEPIQEKAVQEPPIIKNTEVVSDNKIESEPVIVSNPVVKLSTFYGEAKSRRVHILLKPTLHDKLKEVAIQKRTSLNDLIHTTLEQSLKKSKQ